MPNYILLTAPSGGPHTQRCLPFPLSPILPLQLCQGPQGPGRKVSGSALGRPGTADRIPGVRATCINSHASRVFHETFLFPRKSFLFPRKNVEDYIYAGDWFREKAYMSNKQDAQGVAPTITSGVIGRVSPVCECKPVRSSSIFVDGRSAGSVRPS